MVNTKERLSSGERKHIRREKAKERDNIEYLKRHLRTFEDAEERIKEINEKLSQNSLDPNTKALLFIENIWANLRVGKIKPAQKDSRLMRFLNKLQKEQPDIYVWLRKEDEERKTPMVRARNRFFPPVKKHF